MFAYKAFEKDPSIIFCSAFYIGSKAFSLLGIKSLGPLKCARVKCHCIHLSVCLSVILFDRPTRLSFCLSAASPSHLHHRTSRRRISFSSTFCFRLPLPRLRILLIFRSTDKIFDCFSLLLGFSLFLSKRTREIEISSTPPRSRHPAVKREINTVVKEVCEADDASSCMIV